MTSALSPGTTLPEKEEQTWMQIEDNLVGNVILATIISLLGLPAISLRNADFGQRSREICDEQQGQPNPPWS